MTKPALLYITLLAVGGCIGAPSDGADSESADLEGTAQSLSKEADSAESTNASKLKPEPQMMTRTWFTPLYNGIPIDATPWEWNPADGEYYGNEQAADLFCMWNGYSYATLDWDVGKNEPIADRGTYRFSENSPGAAPTYCEWCRWHFRRIRCVR